MPTRAHGTIVRHIEIAEAGGILPVPAVAPGAFEPVSAPVRRALHTTLTLPAVPGQAVQASSLKQDS